MCDYSLGEVPNRLAAEGEQLRVHQFVSGVKGLISATDRPQFHSGNFWAKVKAFFWEEETVPVAICVPPGAQLLMHDIPADLQKRFNVSATEHVTFTQLHAEPFRHRDAVRFSNGQEVLLQKLKDGQMLDVVRFSLPDEESEPTPVDTALPKVAYV